MLCQCDGAQEGNEDEEKNTTEGKEVQKAIQKSDDWKKKRLRIMLGAREYFYSEIKLKTEF